MRMASVTNYPQADQKLKDLLHKRNNMVHRFSLSNTDRMLVTNATYIDVQHLTDEANKFADECMNGQVQLHTTGQ